MFSRRTIHLFAAIRIREELRQPAQRGSEPVAKHPRR